MSTTLQDLLDAPRAALAQQLRNGHPIDPRALDNQLYRGISLGLPAWAEKLSWKTFAKTFYRGEDDGLYGWNVRLNQTGITGPFDPKRVKGQPKCVGFYGVTACEGYDVPQGTDRGLLIQYRFGPNAPLTPLHLIRDPLVAVRPDDPTLLLGWSYIHLFGGLRTPSYFALQLERPLDYVPDVMHTWTRPKKMLSA